MNYWKEKTWIYKSFILLLLFSSVSELGAAEDIEQKTEKHDPSWIGWLNMPKEEEMQSEKIDIKSEPDIWKAWKKEEAFKIQWIPKGGPVPLAAKADILALVYREKQEGKRQSQRRSRNK